MRIFQNEVIKFLIVGMINTTIGLGTIYILLYCNINDYVANLTGYIVGLSISYLLNKYYVFNNREVLNIKEIFNFATVFIVSYSINLLILYISLEYTLNYTAQFLAMSGYTITNFILNKYITFNTKKEYKKDETTTPRP